MTFVVVGQMGEYARFTALAYPYTASEVAQVDLDNQFKLQGFSQSIVSDRILKHVFRCFIFSTRGGVADILCSSLDKLWKERRGDYMCTDKPKNWNMWLSMT